jgi:acyl-CoA synthetase (AMP-forming)/AMP-acid ligase II
VSTPGSTAAAAPAAATVFDAFAATAHAHGGNAFLHIPRSARGRDATAALELTYATTLAHVTALADRYRAQGWGVGHRIATLLENGPEAFLHWLAINAIGASAVPLNPDYRAAELRYVLEHSEAALAVVLGPHADKLRALGLPGLAVVVEPGLDAGTLDLPPAPRPARQERPALATEAALLYTSGTTGNPKGCIIPNLYPLNMARFYLSEGGLCTVHHGTERLITPLPLFHMNALCVSTMAMIASAGCVVQLDRFHPSSWWQDCVDSRATFCHYLGVMPAILLAQPEGPLDRRHTIRFGFGANANPRDHQRFEARFGFPLCEAWAMTETGAGASVTASREPRHVGTRCIGRERPDECEIRLVDDHDVDVPAGQPGNLIVRHVGPDPRYGFFAGYFKDEAATEHAWRGGWFHTGDVLRRGEDGQLHFVDRSKNIIRRSGENIAALEVEAAVADHPAIRAIAVIAAPDATRDEEVMACIVATDPALRTRETAVAIQDRALERLAYYKAPGWVAFVDALPTTATNKVQKAKLSDFGANPLAAPHCFDLRDRKKRTKT